MDWPLYWRLPPKDQSTSDEILNRFLDYISSKDLELYPAQEEAILALLEGGNVILNTPTGSGKSLVAMALLFNALALDRRSYYTCPIKALVNEKFRDLCTAFGPDQVGMITGDAAVNSQAPIICCTAEILSNLALREGDQAQVDDVVMDEFHYYSDKQRGVAWQVPLLSLPQARFLLMSATLGEMDFFSNTLTALNGKPTHIVTSDGRPVPLDFDYRETPLHETVADLVSKGQAPVYLVNFSQREAAEEAQNLLSVDFCSKEEKKAILEALQGTKFQSPYGKEIQRILKHGIGLHHAGLLPKYRVLVERLAQQGLLKVISGTDTLGVGVNVPIRTVLFTKLCKYDGEKTGILGVREFHQIAGRAGRRGFDTRGTVVAQAPAHVIENLRLKQKAAGDAKKLRKIVPRNPPPHGFVMWTKETFQRLITSRAEPLISRFRVDHAMLLNVLSRENGPRVMQKLIRNSHENPAVKKLLRKSAFELFRSLLDRGIVEYVHNDRDKGGTQSAVQIRVNTDLQIDFSLNQTLSLYLLDTLKLLRQDSETYALDALTLVESILEGPELILRKQLDRLKSEKMAEMKAAGIEYEERIEELEKLEHPKPNRDFIYDTFNRFRDAHPWIGQENIRPKSIAREMYENFHSFADYVREYDLQRVEGLLLRYLSETYKVLEQTVPEVAKDDELRAMAIYFGTMVRQVDSSLIEDWENMRSTSAPTLASVPTSPLSSSSVNGAGADQPIDHKSLTLVIRNQVFGLVRALANRDYETFVALLERSDLAHISEIEQRMSTYYIDHQNLRTDPGARHPRNTLIRFQNQNATIEQILIDVDDHNDWALRLSVDLSALSRETAQPAVTLVDLGPVGSFTR
ncbi:MAG: DEAD/DEAH box helicase [Bdellovibrionales bacterium]